jgi:hypothetical protein
MTLPVVPCPTPVLTLHQPWASLIALGVKTIETRSWSTKYRGPLAIHAGAGWTMDSRRAVGTDPIGHVIASRGLRTPFLGYKDSAGKKRWLPGDLPLGAIVATCTLVDVVPIVEWGADPQRDHITIGTDRRLRSWAFVWGSAPLAWRKREPHDVTDQIPYGDFTPDRFAWLLADITPVDPPVPFKGGQGLTRKWTP